MGTSDHRPSRRDDRLADVYILSHEHSPASGLAVWWCPDGRGYTTDLDAAGLYAPDRARNIVESANRGGVICEVAVDQEDARRQQQGVAYSLAAKRWATP